MQTTDDQIAGRRKRPRRVAPKLAPRKLGVVSEPLSSDPVGEIRRSFLDHRGAAERRGVPFLFTLAEWCAWWQFEIRWACPSLRGHDLVMMRFGDAGPYSPENVYCYADDGQFNPDVQRQTAT